MLRRVDSFETDEKGLPVNLPTLAPASTFVICRDEEMLPVRPLESRQAIVDWIEHCVLGDLRTLLVGIDAFLQQRDRPRPLGGGNFLLAAGCCMALEYFGQIYGRGHDATAAARRYVEDFLRPVDARYLAVFGILWSAFRNGIVHGSWPQVICVQQHAGHRIAVGANPCMDGEHLESAAAYDDENFVISSARFFADIEASVDRGFRAWILDESDDGVLARAAPRLLEIRDGDVVRVREFQLIRRWNAERAKPAS